LSCPSPYSTVSALSLYPCCDVLRHFHPFPTRRSSDLPLGAALGGGIGAAARKSYADKFLVLEGPGGKTNSVLLKGRLEMINAEALIESVRKVQRNAAQQETAE